MSIAAAGCGTNANNAAHVGSAHIRSTLSATARSSEQNVIAICSSEKGQVARSSGGPAALELDTKTLVAEAKRTHNRGIAQVDAFLRDGPAGDECAPSYATRIDAALLPQAARGTVESAGFTGLRSEDEALYTARYGSHESEIRRYCITRFGEFASNLAALENFLYLLQTGNESAQHLLTNLRHECANL